VRGIIKNWSIIEQIDTNKYDIILFNEIWQIQSFEFIKIKNFKLANIYQRNTSRGGGVLIFIKENLSYKKIESPVVQGIIESTAILVDNLIIASIYRPPSGRKSDFTDKIIEWIESFGNKSAYIAGDYNMNSLNEDIEFYNTINANTNLKHKINEVTRVASNTGIDNILTNLNGKHIVSSICIADHQGLYSDIKLNTQRRSPKTYTYREMKEHNWSKFANAVELLRIRGDNINDKWSNLTNDIKITIENSFPEKVSNKNYKFSMSRGLQRSKNKKNKLLKQYKRGEIEKERYIAYNRVYRKLIAKVAEETFKTRLEEAGSDSKKKWRVLKDEMKMSEDRDEITKLTRDNITITGGKNIAIEFKKHFETCANALAENIPNSGECEILFNQQNEWGFTTE